MSNSTCIRGRLPIGAPPNSSFQEIPTHPTEFEQVQQEVAKVVAGLSQVDFRPSGPFDDADDRFDPWPGPSHRKLQATDRSPQRRHQILNAAAASAQTDGGYDAGIQVVPLSRICKAFRIPPKRCARRALRWPPRNRRSSPPRARFAEARAILDPASPITYQLNKTLEDISGAARSTRELADFLQRNPSAIIRGRAVSQDGR